MSRINETLKQLVDDLDLDRRLEGLTAQAEQALTRALDVASEYAEEHRDALDEKLVKLSATVDERTDGRFGAQIAKAREQVAAGVDKLVERRR